MVLPKEKLLRFGPLSHHRSRLLLSPTDAYDVLLTDTQIKTEKSNS